MNFLLTYNDNNPAAFELTRWLHSRGHQVHHLRLTGRPELLVVEEYQVLVLQTIEAIVAEQGIQVMIPFFEEAFFLGAHRDRILCRTLLNPPEVYQALHDKRKAEDFNRRHGLPCVPTMLLERSTTPQDVEAFLDGHDPVLKHRDSRGGYGTHIFRSVEALFLKLRTVPPEAYVLQRRVAGAIWILQGVFRDGELQDYEILEKVPMFSDETGVVRYSPYHKARHDEGGLTLLRQVGALTGYQGMLEFECLGFGGDLQILEYNPRFSADFLHSVIGGGSFAENTVLAYAAQSPKPHRPSGGMTRNEGITHRMVRRQFGARPLTFFDMRWLLRLGWAELERAQTHLRSPVRRAPRQPESSQTLDTLPLLEMVWVGASLRPSLHSAPKYQLCRLTRKDRSAYADLMEQAGMPELANDKRMKDDAKHTLQDGVWGLVDRDTKRLVGSARAMRSPSVPGAGELGWVAVLPDHQGQGLGAELSHQVIKQLLESGCEPVMLVTHGFRRAAIKTYLKLEFVPVISSPEVGERWKRICDEMAWPFTPQDWPTEVRAPTLMKQVPQSTLATAQNEPSSENGPPATPTGPKSEDRPGSKAWPPTAVGGGDGPPSRSA